MEFSDITSIIALIISMISVGSSLWFKIREQARIKAISRYDPPTRSEEGPGAGPELFIEVANIGYQGNVYLEYLYVGYKGAKGLSIVDTDWELDNRDRHLLVEGDKFFHKFDPDNDLILVDQDGNQANRLFVQDFAGTRYPVKGARKNLKDYLKAREDF